MLLDLGVQVRVVVLGAVVVLGQVVPGRVVPRGVLLLPPVVLVLCSCFLDCLVVQVQVRLRFLVLVRLG